MLYHGHKCILWTSFIGSENLQSSESFFRPCFHAKNFQNFFLVASFFFLRETAASVVVVAVSQEGKDAAITH